MRPQRFIRTLTKIEGQEIEQLFRRGPNNRVRKRAQAIRLSAMDYTVTHYERKIRLDNMYHLENK